MSILSVKAFHSSSNVPEIQKGSDFRGLVEVFHKTRGIFKIPRTTNSAPMEFQFPLQVIIVFTTLQWYWPKSIFYNSTSYSYKKKKLGLFNQSYLYFRNEEDILKKELFLQPIWGPSVYKICSRHFPTTTFFPLLGTYTTLYLAWYFAKKCSLGLYSTNLTESITQGGKKGIFKSLLFSIFPSEKNFKNISNINPSLFQFVLWLFILYKCDPCREVKPY